MAETIGATGRLITAVATEAGVSAERLNRHMQRMLGTDSNEPAPSPRTSSLNGDGTPLQVYVSSRETGMDVRLILDPAYAEPCPRQRFARARALLARELRMRDAAKLMDALDPGDAPDDAAALFGPLWLAWDLRVPSIACYLGGAALGMGDGWTAGVQRLNLLLPSEGRWQDALEPLRARWRLASFACGVAPGGRIAPRLYLRATTTPDPNDMRLVPDIAALGTFMQIAADGGPWPATGLTLAISFAAATGAIAGTKLDLCLCDRCCGDLGGRAAVLRRLAQRYRLDGSVSRLLQAGDAAVVGLGLDQGGRPRINLYLKPRPA